MSLLKIKNLNKFYKIDKDKNFQVLNNINLEFNKGEIVSIVGESGSGKSTLMNVIGGLDSDFDGEININGKNLNTLSKKELEDYRKNNVGFIFQSFNLIPHLTVLDNVTIAMTLSNVKKEEREKRAKEILEELGLIKHINKKPNQLSGGQKQRVAIARALVNDPDIILADEPTGALDSKTTEQVLKIISMISKKGKLIIMVTHSDMVSKSGSRVVKINDGKIIKNEIIKEKEEVKENNEPVNELINKNLSFSSSIKLALKNMKQKIGRNILLTLGSSIGIMSLLLILAVGKGLNQYVNDTMYKNVNPLVTEVNKTVKEDKKDSNFSSNYVKTGGTFSKEEIEKLKNIENVTKVEYGHSELGTSITQISYEDKNSLIDIFKTAGPDIVENQIVSGSVPKSGEIMIGENVLKSLNLTKETAIGKTITLKINKNKKEMTQELKISGIFNIDANGFSFSRTIAYIDYNDLMSLYEKNNIDKVVSIVYLTAKDIKYTDEISKKVKELGFEDSVAKQIVSTFTDMLNVISYILAAVAAISLFVSSIMILVVLNISVVERTTEIGVLKAIGARVKDIKRIFVSEAFLIGLFSGILGVTQSYILSFIINKISMKLFDINITIISLEFIVFAILTSTIVSVLSGLLPSVKAAKLDPIESLRHE